VIRDPRDASAVAEELRSRLHSMAIPPPPPTGWQARTKSVKDSNAPPVR
jgi:hypothetical protein